MRMLILQVQPDAGPGYLGEWARDRDIDLDIVDVRAAERLPSPREYQAAAALGADSSWATSNRSTWMTRELDWLHDAEAAGVPVLGICFGAQALATLHGGEVHRLPRPEVGWLELSVTPSADIPTGPWLSWHEDFIVLPPAAHELAHSSEATHIFEVGLGFGIQFHPEADTATIRRWVDQYSGRDLGPSVRSPAGLLAESIKQANAAQARAYRLFDVFTRTFLLTQADDRTDGQG